MLGILRVLSHYLIPTVVRHKAGRVTSFVNANKLVCKGNFQHRSEEPAPIFHQDEIEYQ